MFVLGSDFFLGIESVLEFFMNVGYNLGMIYWIIDGIELE